MNQYVNDYFSSIPKSYTDELMHYGVLGMKWGQHKARRLEAASSKQSLKGNTKKANQLKRRADAENRKYEHRKAFNEAYKADREERNKYKLTKDELKNIKKKNLDRYMDYQINKQVYGKKAANRIDYERQKRGKEGAKQEQKKSMKKIIGITLATTAVNAMVMNPKNVMKIQKMIYDNNNNVYLNNLAIDAYSKSQGGLKNYNKRGVSLGFKAASRGKKWMDAVRSAGL